MVEATTVGGRDRGPGDFTLSVSYVEGCDVMHLGDLSPEEDLTDTGLWSLDTCGSAFVVAHPAYRYSFNLPEDGRVRIDLESEHGDAVLSLASDKGIIAANDDGGGARNSRIELFLQAGVYLIEATTYLQRDLQPLIADFTLTVSMVDEEAKLDKFQLKIEETHAPDVVYAGKPFDVHYRVGNIGYGDLADVGGHAWTYVVAPPRYLPVRQREARFGGRVLGARGFLPHGRRDGERGQRFHRRGEVLRGDRSTRPALPGCSWPLLSTMKMTTRWGSKACGGT